MDLAMPMCANEFHKIVLLSNANRTKVLKAGNYRKLWLDGMTPFSNGSAELWYFTRTEEKFNYTLPWPKGSPDNYQNNEKCMSLVLRKEKDGFVLNDDTCTYITSFVCEKPQLAIATESPWIFPTTPSE
jgi:hypothetical protein